MTICHHSTCLSTSLTSLHHRVNAIQFMSGLLSVTVERLYRIWKMCIPSPNTVHTTPVFNSITYRIEGEGTVLGPPSPRIAPYRVPYRGGRGGRGGPVWERCVPVPWCPVEMVKLYALVWLPLWSWLPASLRPSSKIRSESNKGGISLPLVSKE